MAIDEDTTQDVGIKDAETNGKTQHDGEDVKPEIGSVTQQSRCQEELDAPSDDRVKISRGDVFWSKEYATCNAMQSSDSRLLLTLCDAGFQYLLAGTRCSVGVKSGRYLFEVKIVEMLNPAELQRSTARTPMPRQLLRLGVSVNPQSYLLDDSSEKAYFDSEGHFVSGSKRIRASAQLGRDHVVGLLINVDPSSANANTISLFRDGVRVAEPQPLPETIVGKTLYPCITWKNITMQINFGPRPKKPLPFSCRMLTDAATADLEVTQAVKKDKHEVLFPVGLPEQGLFDWLDDFLAENRQYVELSDRQVVEWALKSGVQRQRGHASSSIDKPGMNFGIPLLDDMNVQKTLASIAPALKRNLVIMELRSNLLSADRKAFLAKFPSSRFKRVAVVAMGKPSADFVAEVHERMLTEKRTHNEISCKRRKLEGDAEHDLAKDGEKQDCDRVDEEEEIPLELTEEEKNTWYYKREAPEISQTVLAKDFASFSLPTTEEGFDEIRYVWQPEDVCRQHLRAWTLDLKKTMKAEHLEPSDWFKEQFAQWSKLLAEWRRKQHEEKNKASKGASAAKKDDANKADGEEGVKDEAALADADLKKQRDADEAYDVDDVENIDDIGNGRPLFAHFEYEDWVLLGLRFEFHLLLHAFQRDLDDPDRPGFPEMHLLYYYNRYYKKNINLSLYKMTDLAQLLELLQDTLKLDSESGFLQPQLRFEVSMDRFIRFTEECRRERQRCIDAGDETATLEFSKPPPTAPPPSKGDDKRPTTPPPSKADDKSGSRSITGSTMPTRYGDRGTPLVGASRGPVLHGGGTSSRGAYAQTGGKGAPPRSYNPPPPTRGSTGSYGGPPSQKRPMPPTLPYASKQPRYGTGAGGGSAGSVPRSSYPPSQGRPYKRT